MTHARMDDIKSENLLRFIFDDAVFAVRLPANATFGDIAWMMASLTPYHEGVPIAIDVRRGLSAAPGMPLHAS